MTRTFVLINNTSLGGAERRLGRLFARMAEAGEGALVINAGLWKRLQAAGVVSGDERRVWKLPEPYGRLAAGLGIRGAAAFALRKLDYLLFAVLLLLRYGLAPRRLFHLALGGPYVALPLMLLRPDHRVVISVTNRSLAEMVGVAWALPFYRYALGRCDAVEALTDGVREDLVGRGIAFEKIAVPAGSVIDLERFRPADKDAWVVFAGRLVEGKNPRLFLEAVPAIRRAVPAARFFLLGDGPLRQQLEADLDRLSIRDAVEMGFRADLAPVLARTRVFVSLQWPDNYPSQSLLEAMACGAASVATDVGLTWRLVDEDTGVRVKPFSDDVAQAVTLLLNDPARCERLGLAARRRVEQEHSEERYRAHLHGLYDKVAA